MTLYLLDPIQPGAAWAPFAGTLPLGELRAGAWRIHDRWQRALGGRVAGHIAPHAAGPRPAKAIPVVAATAVSGPAWVVDSTFSPKLPMRTLGSAKRLLSSGRAVAWRLDAGESWSGPHNDGDGIVIEGLVLRGAFDLITALEQQLFNDLLGTLDGKSDPIPEGVVVFGNAGAIALRGAILEPGVILDARKGAIILERGVDVRAGTRIEGPARVDHDSFLLGGHLRHISVGPHCRIHGEVSTSVFQGYANKSHDGFLGHSVLGEWVNLGAGTITSNLKNTYGPIRLDIGTARVETGRTNLGTLFGDHVKTAIGTLLPTGAVVGSGANLFGAPRAPKWVPAFAWGGDRAERLTLDAFLETAGRILPRRQVAIDAAMEASLRALHARLARD
jgi:UDP-N-acetylglucosamine diphosphorylase/glucosamine-1-phosphate N-acetyltransferase